MRMVQWKSGCDYYLLSYEHFYLQIFALQVGLEKVLLTATSGMSLRANGEFDVSESFL